MTQEEEQLLLKDLCARMSHGVICQFIWTYSNETTDGEDVIANKDDIIRCIDICTEEIQANYYGEWVDLEHCKPYLRSMSSMSEEETYEYDRLVMCNASWVVDDWLLEHHFDYRGLIKKSLAIVAPDNMYK